MAQPQAYQRQKIMRSLNELNKSNIQVVKNAGTPIDGTSGTKVGVAGPGCLLIDTTNCELYQNIGSLVSVVWTLISNAGTTS